MIPEKRESREKERQNFTLESVFKLSSHKTDVKTEVMVGITTFMTMAYILAVNPSILDSTGMDSTGMDSTTVLLATDLASFLGTLCMGLMANLPFALSLFYSISEGISMSVISYVLLNLAPVRPRRSLR